MQGQVGSPKFASRYIGPFTIKSTRGDNAYELDLPPQLQIHPVINISRLKAHKDGHDSFPDRPSPHPRPPPEVIDADGNQLYEVERILAQRGNTRSRQYLVAWKGYPLWEATWTPRSALLPGARLALESFERGLEADA